MSRTPCDNTAYSNTRSRNPRIKHAAPRAALVLCALMIAGGPIAGQEADEGEAVPQSDEPTGDAEKRERNLDSFFEEAFGLSPEPSPTPVGVRVDRRFVGEVEAMVTPAGRLHSVNIESLALAIEELLRDDVVERLRNIADSEGQAEIGEFEELGIGFEYDRRTLSAELHLPGELRTTRTISVRERSLADADDPRIPVVEPERVSGGVGLATAFSYSGGTEMSGDGRGEVTLSPFVSAFEWTASAQTRFSFSGAGASTEVSDARLRRFWPDTSVLLTLGDATPRTNIFQSRGGLLGVHLSRDVEPESVLGDPLTEFVLDEAQRVEVWVNGSSVYERHLGPGSYELADVPVLQGLNRVELRFPETGMETVGLSSPHDSSLLPRGQHSYSNAVGIAPSPLARNLDVQPITADDLRISSRHRYGFTNSFTAELGLQYSPQVFQGSAGAAAAMPFGTVGLTTAISRNALAATGFGVRLTYGLFRPAIAVRPSLRVSVAWFGTDLSDPGRPTGRGGRPLQFSAAYGQRLPAGFSGTLRGELQHDPVQDTSRYRISLGITAPRVERTRVSLRLEYVGDTAGDPASRSRFLGNLTIRMTPRSGPTLSYQQELSEPRTSISLSESGEAGALGRYSARVATRHDLGTPAPVDRADAQIALSGQRATASGSTVGVFSGDGIDFYRLRAGAETGLLFAGSTLAWHRIPSESGFAIVRAPDGSEAARIEVRSDGRRQTATPGVLGRTVIFGSRAYEPIPVGLRALDLPLGQELENDRLNVLSGLRTGTVITPEFGGKVFVRGYLVDDAGNPVALEAAIVRAADSDAEPAIAEQRTFTNSRGRFEARQLRPGDYEIVVPRLNASATFTIDADARGLLQLDELRLQGENG